MIKAYIGLEKHNKKSISARISIASLNNIKEPVFAPQAFRTAIKLSVIVLFTAAELTLEIFQTFEPTEVKENLEKIQHYFRTLAQRSGTMGQARQRCAPQP